MSNRRRLVSISVLFLLFAGTATVGVLTTKGAGARAQTPPAPCVCSRVTAIVGADEVNAGPGPLQPRFGVAHCQCGTATCVSQVSYASVGTPQLFCVK